MSQPLRAAVVGTGFIGPVHVEGLRRAGVFVTGSLGSESEKSRAAAKRLGLDRAYESLDDLLSDSTVDVVHITSPNRFHFDQATRALHAGKHVLCEKPLATNSTESLALVRLAEDQQLAAGVNYNIRYYPLCVEAAEKVRQGALGRLFHVAGSYVQDWLFRASDFNWRVLAEEGGELRAAADIGTHWLDLVQHVVREPVVAVFSDLYTVFDERERPVGGSETFTSGTRKATHSETVAIDTEDYGAILLRFRSGARGVLWVSQVTAGRKNCLRFELAGSGQSIAWCSEMPNELWQGHRDQANELLVRDPSLMSDRAAQFANYPGGHNEGFPDTFKQLFRDFYGSIEAGTFLSSPTFPTFADGHREIVLCEAILESHRKQQWIQVEPKS